MGAHSSAIQPLQFNCTNQNPTFTLQGIFYDYLEVYDSPTHLASKEATISFDLVNSAVQYITPCSASILAYDFGANIAYHCDTPSNATVGSSANFTLSGRTGLYTVNQTWTCGNETFLGYGTTEITLWGCQAMATENSRWSAGETYNTTEVMCPPVDGQIKPYILVL